MEQAALRQENNTLRAASDGERRRTAALETQISSLQASNDELERRLRDMCDNQAQLANEVSRPLEAMW